MPFTQVGSNGIASTFATVPNPDGSVTGTVNTESQKATYSFATAGTAIAAAATDLLTISGSATKTIRVLSVGIGGTATAAGVLDAVLIKRSVANNGGTSANPTAVAHDSTDLAATATLGVYTANASTLGTSIGPLRAAKLNLSTTTGVGQPVVYNFTNLNDKAPVLRGTNQVLALNLNGGTAAGSSADLWIEWTEE